MRIAILSFGALTLMLCVMLSVVTLPAGADPLVSTDNEPILRDPKPSDSHAFAPGLATEGAADPGQARDAVPAPPRAACNPANPCALPTPLLNHVEAPRPAPPG